MLIWHSILTVRPGMRKAYIEKIQQAGLIERFLKHPGNLFYNLAASVTNPDQLIVVDGWESEATFIAHDTSSDVDVWRELYARYVLDCQAELYTCTPQTL